MATELYRSSAFDDVERWMSRRGLKTDWVRTLRYGSDVKFYKGDYPKPTYYRSSVVGGGYIGLPEDCVDKNNRLSPDRLESIIHEMWHAYCDFAVEKHTLTGDAAQHEILLNSVRRGIRTQAPAGADLGEAADEVIGNYISVCVERFKLHMPNAKDEAHAQRIWDELKSESLRTIDLSGREYGKIAANYVISPREAQRLRERFFGLGEKRSRLAARSEDVATTLRRLGDRTDVERARRRDALQPLQRQDAALPAGLLDIRQRGDHHR